MEWHQWLVIAFVAAASVHVGRVLWREFRGLLRPDEGDLCPGCGECGGESDALKRGARPAPGIRVTPLVQLDGRPDDEPPGA